MAIGQMVLSHHRACLTLLSDGAVILRPPLLPTHDVDEIFHPTRWLQMYKFCRSLVQRAQMGALTRGCRYAMHGPLGRIKRQGTSVPLLPLGFPLLYMWRNLASGKEVEETLLPCCRRLYL